MTENTKTLEIHYLKTANYRSFHIDGVFGGITPSGGIYMELFLQRAPTPKVITHELNDDNSLGKELARESKTGLIREIEAGLIFDLQTAELVQSWLAEKIKTLKSLSERPKEK